MHHRLSCKRKPTRETTDTPCVPRPRLAARAPLGRHVFGGLSGGLLAAAAMGAAVLAGTALVTAAPMAGGIVRHVIGAGGLSASTAVRLRGTAGQGVSSGSSGPGLRLSAGFWPGLPGRGGPTAPTPGATTATPGATETAAATVTTVASLTPGAPAVWTVNTVDDEDDGSCAGIHCSLREAITAANGHAGPDTIRFSIPSGANQCQPGGPCVIRPTRRLPQLVDDSTTIDGFSQPGSRPNASPLGQPLDAVLRIVLDGTALPEPYRYAAGLQLLSSGNTVRGLVVGGFYTGIDIVEATGNQILGNYIGTDASGASSAGNRCIGISISGYQGGHGSSGNVIGGTSPQARNLVSGNGCNGVWFGPVGDNRVQGNYIGTDATGARPLPNEVGGVRVSLSSGNRIGGSDPAMANVIAFNATAGVILDGGPGTTVANTVSRNAIHDNEGPGIVLQSGANAGVAAPEIDDVSAARVSGTACAGCTVEVFSDANDEGAVFEGSIAADAAGRWSLDLAPDVHGPNLTTTATDGQGNTSAFSAAVALPGAQPSATPSRTGTPGSPTTPGTGTATATGSPTGGTPRPTGTTSPRPTASATRTPGGTPPADDWQLHLPRALRRAPGRGSR